MTMAIRFKGMTRIMLFLAVALVILGTSGCESNKGSREFIPGKGWTPTN
jgi:hypothetical protein